MTPKFSASAHARPFPWNALPARTRDAARVESAFAHALAASQLSSSSPSPSSWSRLRRLLRADATTPIAIRDLRVEARAFDPHAASCEVRSVAGAFVVRGSSLGVRALAQSLLGGPDELRAPRPLDDVEASVWTLVVATLLEDLGVPGHVWPSPAVGAPAHAIHDSADAPSRAISVDCDVHIGALAIAVRIDGDAELLVRVDRSFSRAVSSSSGTSSTRTTAATAWLDTIRYELPVVAGRCALHRDDLGRLAVRSVITLERPASGAAIELDVFDGALGLEAELPEGPGGHGQAGAAGRGHAKAREALPAVVATSYVRRDMSLPDEAHVELTVTVGTTQLTLRQITELALGQIIELHRPLGGPFELRAAGRVLGRGELVDVDGELAVRIVSLGDQEQ